MPPAAASSVAQPANAQPANAQPANAQPIPVSDAGSGWALARAALRDPMGAAMLASLALAALELTTLEGFSLGLAAVVVVLHAALGLLIGAVLTLLDAAQRWRPQLARISSAVYALGSVPPLVFVSWDLFEGSQAAALPGARFGHVWLPVVSFVGVAMAVAAGRRLLPIVGAVAAACILALGALLAEAANRLLFTSEYADVHAFLVVVSCVLASLAVSTAAKGWRARHGHGAGSRPATSWRRRLGPRLALAAIVGLGLLLVLPQGMADKHDRRLVVTEGSSARHLVRVVRLGFDADGDGAATVLGGGDCNDDLTAVHPSAVEVPGNGMDEDCDGRDLVLPPRDPNQPDWNALQAAWQASAAVTDTLARTRAMNVLVVAVDTLRADALTPERAAADAPHLSALLAESVHFQRAFATGAGTDLSVSSTITGRIDPFTLIETTLAEAMQATGRVTGAVYPTEVLRYAGEVMLTRGMNQVARYVNDRGQRDVGMYTTSAATTTRVLTVLDALRGRRRPFFLWAHYFDVHEHAQVQVTDQALSGYGQRYDLGSRTGKYRALLALTDHEIGRLVQSLRERGLWDQTIVVLFSDHGESLGEDPRLPANHGRFVYNALTHVPLAIRVPGVAPRRVDTPVSVVDVMPTLLALTGATPPAELDGSSLLPLFLGDAPGLPPRPIALNETEQWGIIDWPYKLMVRPADNIVELYDLSQDFGERRDLAEAMPERVSALRSVQARLPRVELDRTRQGRRTRDALARPPPRQRRGG